MCITPKMNEIHPKKIKNQFPVLHRATPIVIRGATLRQIIARTIIPKIFMVINFVK
jgi:hypothetical protein